MAKNTRFVTNNLLAVTGRLRNGGAGPAVSEDAQYPMTNLEMNDRLAFWRSANALAADYHVQFDLGADLALSAFAVHGFRRAAGQADPTTLVIGTSTAASGPSTYTTQATLTLARDVGYAPTVSVIARYLDFGIQTPGGGFSIANFLAGSLISTGMLYSPGAEIEDDQSRYDEVTPSGNLVTTYTGLEGGTLVLPYRSIQTTLKETLRTIARVRTPITYFDPFDNVYQVLAQSGRSRHSHQWSPGDLWNMDLALTRLP